MTRAEPLWILERRFLDASIAVWREIDRYSEDEYQGIEVTEQGTELRRIEREAWNRYRDALDYVDPRCSYTFPLPGWMGEDQADPCRCDLPTGHDGKHACEHTREKADREPQPGDGPDYHAEHAAWEERQRRANASWQSGAKSADASSRIRPE